MPYVAYFDKIITENYLNIYMYWKKMNIKIISSEKANQRNIPKSGFVFLRDVEEWQFATIAREVKLVDEIVLEIKGRIVFIGEPIGDDIQQDILQKIIPILARDFPRTSTAEVPLYTIDKIVVLQRDAKKYFISQLFKMRE